jgi:hypothetical protein
VDTDVTALGTELVTNGSMASDTSWTKGTGWSISGGQASCNGSQTGDSRLSQSVSITAGKFYRIKFDWTFSSTDMDIRLGGSVKWSLASSGTYPSGTSVDFVMQAGSSNTELWVNGNQHFTGTIDNVSVTEAVPDRSVKGNGLAVHGSPTVSAVATGAELKCISGFSTTAGYTANGTRLQQPYNSDLDFTGDWEISYWVNAAASHDITIHWTNATGGDGWMIYHNAGTSYFLDGNWDDYTSYMQTNSISSLKGRWCKTSYVCTSGILSYYLDGVAVTNSTATKNISTWNLTSTSAHQLAVYAGNTAHELTLFRISATAPSAEQIKEIYEAEKPMFQANAKCTLNGSSDAVTALAYDDSTELLHVGTSGGRSAFQGLRRVDETSTSTSEIAAQGGLIVEETP